MSRSKIWIGVAVALVAIGTTTLSATSDGAEKPVSAEDQSAREARELASGLRATPLFINGGPLDLIGTLVEYPYWAEKLPVAAAQAQAITRLDQLVRDARDHSWLTDADWLEGNPPEFREYAARNNERRQQTFRHAQRMVAVGLLTESQAALVIQRVLSDRQATALYDENVQELIGVTKGQLQKMAQLDDKEKKVLLPFNPFTTVPEEQKKLAEFYETRKHEHDAAVMGILTPEQQELWSRLAAERTLPADPPELPALSDAKAARIKIEVYSPIFRLLAERPNAFNLSADRRKFLSELEEVTRAGLFWIGLRNSAEQAEQVENIRAEFVKHAEHVALQGILTERQAADVQAAIPQD